MDSFFILKQDNIYHWLKSTKLSNLYTGIHHYYAMFYNAWHLQQIYSADFQNQMPLLETFFFHKTK